MTTLSISSTVRNTEDRVNFLKENRQEVVSTILYFVPQADLRDTMISLMQVFESNLFYSYCNMETRELNIFECIERMTEENGNDCINSTVDFQNFMEDERAKAIKQLND
jgi:hypothetical protein